MISLDRLRIEPLCVHHDLSGFDCGETERNLSARNLAVRVQTMITLGEMAYRHNTTFTFDPKTRTTTPDIKKFMVAQKA